LYKVVGDRNVGAISLGADRASTPTRAARRLHEVVRLDDHRSQLFQQKREIEKKTEGTTPGHLFVPVTDIFETPEALMTVVLEMPGVDRDSIEASVENDIVTIQGRIDTLRSMRGCSRFILNTT
jgi:HSP20 family molecular chaperone IbpA